MELYKSTSGDNIYMDILDLDIITKPNFNKFVKLYNKSDKDLCIGSHIGIYYKTQSIYFYIPKTYSKIKTEYPNQKIIYLYKLDKSNKTIIAFSVIDETNIQKKIIEIKLICSHKIKYNIQLTNEIQSLGIFMLNQIYNYYNSKDITIHIFPANEFLTSYYNNWKTPTSVMKKKTDSNGTLVYGVNPNKRSRSNRSRSNRSRSNRSRSRSRSRSNRSRSRSNRSRSRSNRSRSNRRRSNRRRSNRLIRKTKN